MFFYRRNKLGYFEEIRPIDGDIIRSDVLKGFHFRISDLFSRPSLEEILEDQLYNSFAIPSHKKLKQRLHVEKKLTKMEKQRAEVERQRAKVAEDKAERMAAKLRELGISVD